jgi:hypothetical protein
MNTVFVILCATLTYNYSDFYDANDRYDGIVQENTTCNPPTEMTREQYDVIRQNQEKEMIMFETNLYDKQYDVIRQNIGKGDDNV